MLAALRNLSACGLAVGHAKPQAERLGSANTVLLFAIQGMRWTTSRRPVASKRQSPEKGEKSASLSKRKL
jgi:hypothetical protein